MFRVGLVVVPLLLSGCVFFDPDDIIVYPHHKRAPRDHVVLGPAADTYYPNGWASCSGGMYFAQFKSGLVELKREAVGKYGEKVNGLVNVRQ